MSDLDQIAKTLVVTPTSRMRGMSDEAAII
jgi:hypothetical protein